MDRKPVDYGRSPASAPTVREADAAQHPEIERLLRAAYAGYAPVVAAEVFPTYLADVLDFAAEGATVLVAVEDGEVVGTARLHLRGADVDLPAGAAYVRGVAVHPGRAGGGIARALMADCAHRARAAGATGLHLHTAPFMTRAIRLYEGLGYRRTPERDTDSAAHYGLAVHPPLRALAYRLDLTRT
ncbi:GNAT family N-acetyltransferase [Pseudonocardia humida]|uniref:GNAT family N-acetyltransferase n=1 Tax=Pseudonocardia humida TaxID=2800819 RepID=A0ABT1A0L0_9PSEU|nr:GNAT family N-acetyltransferase [Pseudonocardia humida]MCO1656535.1 GNAT family N-acetyltransferase [Pseudonocardia humida]